MSDDQPGKNPTPAPTVARPPVETLTFRTEPVSHYSTVLSELAELGRDLLRSEQKNRVLLLAASLGGVLIVNMIFQVRLNDWLGAFYRAIEKKNLHLIGMELLIFLKLVAILLSVVVAQTWLHERMKIKLREWLTTRLLRHWLAPGRAYRLSISSDEAVNPDQRIQEDVRNLAEMSADLGIGLTQSTLLLVSFIGVLWGMSQNVQFSYGPHNFSIPGFMVWVALLYSLAGSLVTAWVGLPLIPLNEERYTQEANFRFSIVRVNESVESVALYSGEHDEHKIIRAGMDRVLNIMRTVSFALARLTWITSGYGWISLVLPVLVALPGYLHGRLDLGGLMVVVGAFNQVQQSLRWFVDNFAKIADWRAALHRVVVFRNAVMTVDEFEEGDERIQLLPHPEGHLSFEGTKVSLIDGDVVIADATAHILPGERVLITGESGTGKSTLFRAVSGLWPWGSGIIRLPPREETMFLPQKPYMPLGTLAEALRYPKKALLKGEEEAMAEALRRVNLPEFASMLNQKERWDKLMSLGQQQRLAFARLLLHRPKWVFLDEATSALDDKNQALVMSLFQEELKGTSVLSIAHRAGLMEFHHRALHLTQTSSGTILRRRRSKPVSSNIWRKFLKKWHFFRAAKTAAKST
ncbi:MAG: ABC transporter ATP-binding protein/permease [Bdellovibrionaceae bacterium]|nr:ABC transporter ATP-binding protein/permease [Pseudobdellovibrionaceae bacterium]